MLNEFHWCKQNYLIQERIRIYSVLAEVYNKYVKKYLEKIITVFLIKKKIARAYYENPFYYTKKVIHQKNCPFFPWNICAGLLMCV